MNTRYHLLRTLTALITLLMMGLIAHAQQPAFLTNGLVAYYPLDGNGIDVGPFKQNGVGFSIGETTNRFGIQKQASLFGTDFQSGMIVKNGAVPLGATPRTISFWANVANSKAGGYIIAYGETPPTGSGRLIAIRLEQSGGISVLPDYSFRYGVSTPAFSGWHHGVVTIIPPNKVRIFFDGVAQSISVAPPPDFSGFDTAPGQLTIGYWDNHYFDGAIDDVRIYNRALSDSEVTALYKYEKHPPIRSATATLQIANGFVIGADVIDGGVGYTDPPSVTISGSGAGASAIASLANGVVTGVVIISAGHGYDSKTTISIDPPPYPPSQATADATIANGKVSTITVSDGGHGYGTTIPPVSIIGGGGVGAKAVANVVNGSVVSVTITSSGTAYTSVPTVLIAAPPSSPTVSLVVKQVELDMNLVVGYSYKIQASYDGGNTWSDTASAFLATDSLMTKVFTVTSTAQLFRVVQVN